MDDLLMVKLETLSAHKEYQVHSKIDKTDPVQKMLETALGLLEQNKIKPFIEAVGSDDFLKYFSVDAVDGSREPPNWKAIDNG
jgi:hypothetical protein